MRAEWSPVICNKCHPLGARGQVIGDAWEILSRCRAFIGLDWVTAKSHGRQKKMFSVLAHRKPEGFHNEFLGRGFLSHRSGGASSLGIWPALNDFHTLWCRLPLCATRSKKPPPYKIYCLITILIIMSRFLELSTSLTAAIRTGRFCPPTNTVRTTFDHCF